MTSNKSCSLFLAALALTACGTGNYDYATDPKDDETGNEKQAEAWSSQDNPALFASTLEFKLESLPTTGQATNIPWAGSYWPTYEDNINYRWDGANSDSAAMKYQKAFAPAVNGVAANVEDLVSKNHGIDSVTSAKECTQASECDSTMGETCAMRRGATKGRCIATWWGICHAWTPAAILLPEPKRPVTRNGVTFKVQDLKALASLVHNSTKTKFVSLRCEKNAQKEMLTDAYGRTADKECRDTNPGTYHVLLSNYLGINKQAFAEDRTFDHEVWNQPLRGYRVTQKKAVTLAEANALIGVTSVGGTTVTKTGTVAKDAWAHQGSFAVTAGSNVKVVMSGSDDADLYVRFGAQPDTSSYDCRPYAGGSAEECSLTVPAGQTQVFVSVQGYATTSSFSLSITTGGSAPTSYVFNAAATSFVHVKTEVDYIGESSSETDGNLSGQIDRYTHTDQYEYLLELDAAGKIIGGEWLGASKKAHPDFLWLPTAAGTPSVAGGSITYAQVKSLIDESVTDPNQPPPAEKTVTQTGTVAKAAWKQFGPFNVAAGTSLTVTMTGDGDADLYVKKGLAPTTTTFDCRPYKSGSAESCSVAGPGPVYVGVNGYATTSNFSLTIKYVEGGGTPPPPPPAIVHLNESGSVAQGEMKIFQLVLPAGAKVRVTTTAPADVDLYVQLGAAPTTSTYAARGYTGSGNETVDYTAPSSGTLYIGVRGYQASTFTLKTQSL